MSWRRSPFRHFCCAKIPPPLRLQEYSAAVLKSLRAANLRTISRLGVSQQQETSPTQQQQQHQHQQQQQQQQHQQQPGPSGYSIRDLVNESAEEAATDGERRCDPEVPWERRHEGPRRGDKAQRRVLRTDREAKRLSSPRPYNNVFTVSCDFTVCEVQWNRSTPIDRHETTEWGHAGRGAKVHWIEADHHSETLGRRSEQ